MILDYKNKRSFFIHSPRMLTMTEDEFQTYPADARGHTNNQSWIILNKTVFNVKLIEQHLKEFLIKRSPRA